MSVSFLDPETDDMDQFLGPETDILGEKKFVVVVGGAWNLFGVLL